MNEIRDILELLLAQGYEDELFRDLENVRHGKRNSEANCPFCGDTERKFSYAHDKPVWRCWRASCGKSGDWFDYLSERRGLEFASALQELARVAGVSLKRFDGPAAQAQRRRASLVESAQSFFETELWSEAGTPVLTYLRGRGYADDLIRAMGLGAFVSRERLRNHLASAGFADAEVRGSGLLNTQGLGDTHTLAIPWRNGAGQALGITVRSLLGADELRERRLQKYINSYGLERSAGLVGLSAVRGSATVLLVEGVLDALALHAQGLPTVALGGANLSEGQLAALSRRRVRELVLCLDSDEAGQKATEATLARLSESDFRVYVLELPGLVKDPDEFVRVHGIEALRAELPKALPASRWQGRRLALRHGLGQELDPMLWDRAVDALAEAYARIVDTRDRTLFLQGVAQVDPFLDLNDLTPRLDARAEREQVDRARRSLTRFAETVREAAREGDGEAMQDAAEQFLALQRRRSAPRLPEIRTLADLRADLLRSPEARRSGYPALDQRVQILPGTMTVVAGRPNHGKTSMLLSLMANMLELDSSRRFAFFSYEEPRAYLETKLLMALSGVVLHPEHNFLAYLNYIRGRWEKPEPKLDAWVEKLDALLGSGRAVFVEQTYNARELAVLVERMAESGDLGAVFVDYVQKIPSGLRGAGTRQIELQAVCEALRELAVRTQLPVLVGAQLGRGDKTVRNKRETVRADNLREAGDIEQDAAVVLGLFNESVEVREEAEAGGENLPPSFDPVPLELHVLKNRHGQVGGKPIVLELDGRCYRVRERRRSL